MRSRSRRRVEKAGGGMSDILYGGVDGAEGIFGQWAAYVGMTSLWLSSSLTTVGAEGVVAAVVAAMEKGPGQAGRSLVCQWRSNAQSAHRIGGSLCPC